MTAPGKSGVTALGSKRAAVLTAWRDPVFRGGLFLTVSSSATALVGLAYWSVAARSYATPVVGRSAAAVAAMTLLGGFSQLNLTSALIRFVPGAGRDVRRLVLGAYGATIVVSVATGACFLAIAPSISSQFHFLTDRPLVAVGFVASVAAWTVFTMQDGVLTGLRLAHLVAVENAVFALVKVAIVAAIATVATVDGILVSWWIGILLAVAGTNLFLFRSPLRRHARLEPSGPPVRPGPLARFAVPDYLGGVSLIVAMNSMPFLIIAEKGPSTTAYFTISWQVGAALFLVSGNMGQSLVVETALDQSTLPAVWRRLVRRTLLPLVAAVAAIVALAPYLLRLFGAAYSAEGTTLVRLLVLAAIPNLVVETAAFAARSRRRTVVSSTIQTSMCAGALALGAVLLPVMGVDGIGLAWLITLTLLAAVLLTRPGWWLHAR